MNERVNSERFARARGIVRIAIFVAFGLGTMGGAFATPQSFNYRGTPILTGGVSEEEREAMRQETAPYNVWLVFVERDTGNFLSGVKVSVVDGNENAVVDTVSDGPWLLAQLPPGQYKVRTSDGQEQAITANAGSRAMTIMRLARQP